MRGIIWVRWGLFVLDLRSTTYMLIGTITIVFDRNHVCLPIVGTIGKLGKRLHICCARCARSHVPRDYPVIRRYVPLIRLCQLPRAHVGGSLPLFRRSQLRHLLFQCTTSSRYLFPPVGCWCLLTFLRRGVLFFDTRYQTIVSNSCWEFRNISRIYWTRCTCLRRWAFWDIVCVDMGG